jgi:ATP-binding cassette subfamily C protein LapB|tara:strand:+ start:10046 stop:12169 length:2124 start_codon:yes stop_codon:yes gene_type:complete
MQDVAANTGETVSIRDPLLDVLVALTRLHHKPFSAESLTAGLPLQGGVLTPDLFVRAAERAGFNAAHLQRDLYDITSLVLPVALILDDGNCCILTSQENGEVTVIFPEEPDQTHSMTLATLRARYTGRCLFLRPVHASPDSETSDYGNHWFWSTIRKSRGLYAEVLVASFLVNLFALVTPLFIMNVYDRVVPNQAIETLWVLASGVAIVFMFDLVMKSLRGYFIDTAGKRADILLSSKTFSKVMDIKLSSRPARVGTFANNLQEFDSFREFFTSTTLIAVIDLPFVFLFVLLIYTIGGVLALVPLVAIPLIVIVGMTFQKPLQELITKTFTESARKHAMLIETLTALDTVKSARAEGVMQHRWESFNARIAKLSLKSRLLSLATINIAQVVQQMSTVAIVILGVYAILDGKLSVGGLIACTILTGRSLAPMAQVASILTRYHHSIASYGAIDQLMALPVERPEGRTFLHRPNISGDIDFRDVSFAYPEQQTPAIKEVSFSIREGEKVGIIGKTGSGKSTMQKLMMNFHDLSAGSILVSGTDLKQLDPTDLRRNISYVPQDVTLFSGTVRENIVLGAPLSTDESVLAAAELAGISEFLNEHPEGYDLVVSERGGNLSGGQRQGIAIARAMVSGASILLLDEPTNAMDNSTELIFKDRFEKYAETRTLILVTHKTSMLSLVDRLLVLNNGQLVADGPRDEVVKMLSGAQ